MKYITLNVSYVWKEDTRVEGTQFEYGCKAFNRAKKVDWDNQMELAKAGDFHLMDPSVVIRSYTNIKRIHIDYSRPPQRPVVSVRLFVGITGSGKTRRAHLEQNETPYFMKAPLTKWWDGYQGETNVLIDEFSGKVDITHLLQWFDPYPCNVECKGFSVALKAINFWITSNLTISEWYPDASALHIEALRRRIGYIDIMRDQYI